MKRLRIGCELHLFSEEQLATFFFFYSREKLYFYKQERKGLMFMPVFIKINLNYESISSFFFENMYI